MPVIGLANVQQTGSQPACQTQHLIPPPTARSDSGLSMFVTPGLPVVQSLGTVEMMEMERMTSVMMETLSTMASQKVVSASSPYYFT